MRNERTIVNRYKPPLSVQMQAKRFTVPSVELTDAMSKAGLSGSQWAVLFCLMKHVNRDTGLCNPGVDRIAKQTGLDERTVQKALRKLETVGFIKTKLGGIRYEVKKTSVYFINDKNYHSFAFDGPVGVTTRVAKRQPVPAKPF